MKTKSLFTAAVVLLIPSLAFAAKKNSTQVQFETPVNIAGTQLAPGEYKLAWQGNGPDITVSFIEGRKVVATAPARLVSEKAGEPGAIETETKADNTVVLHAVDLNDESIQFEDEVSATGN